MKISGLKGLPCAVSSIAPMKKNQSMASDAMPLLLLLGEEWRRRVVRRWGDLLCGYPFLFI
jgi:hypothetical protein